MRSVRFPWRDLGEQLAAFTARWPAARADRSGLVFVSPDGQARLRPPLAAMRANPKLRGFDVLRLPRLSVMPVSAAQWAEILAMARA